MSACVLLDPFQLYLEMSVVFGLSILQPLQTAELLGMKMCCWDFFWVWGWNFNKNIVLRVIVEMKICYLHVRNNSYPQDVS